MIPAGMGGGLDRVDHIGPGALRCAGHAQPGEVDAFAARLRVYDIDEQDNCGAWIMHNFPA